MKKKYLAIAISFFVINLITLVSADCTYRDSFFKCNNVDTNQDYVVNNLDNLQDYNIDGVISQSDESIFNKFYSCSWDPNVFFSYIDLVNITKKITLNELYQTFQNMGVTYGIQRLAYLYPNGTCGRGVFEYYGNISKEMVKNGECSYILQASIGIGRGGHLILDRCTLEMNNSDGVSGQFNIKVDGIFTANYSNITATPNNNGGHPTYDFYTTNNSWVQFNLLNSYVSYAGTISLFPWGGLSLRTNNVTFINNTLFGGGEYNLGLGANDILIQNSKFLGSPWAFYNVYSNGKRNKIINSDFSGSIVYDVFMNYNSDISLINTSYRNEKTYYSNTKLYKKWYVDVKVVNALGNPINGANVSFYNVSGAITQNALTNSFGDIPTQNVIEYISNGSTRFNQNNYTILINKLGYLSKNISINITTNENFITPIGSSISNVCVKRYRCIEPIRLIKRRI